MWLFQEIIIENHHNLTTASGDFGELAQYYQYNKAMTRLIICGALYFTSSQVRVQLFLDAS